MNPQLSLNPLWDYHQMVVYPFMVNALRAGTIVAVLAGVVGWFVVLRRQAFTAHTLAVVGFPGAAGAVLLGLSAVITVTRSPPPAGSASKSTTVHIMA